MLTFDRRSGTFSLDAPGCALAVANPRGLWVAKDGRDESLIVRVSLNFAEGPAAWEVGFREVD